MCICIEGREGGKGGRDSFHTTGGRTGGKEEVREGEMGGWKERETDVSNMQRGLFRRAEV